MNKRIKLLWQIICVIACAMILFNIYKLYYKNDNILLGWENYNNEEIGTDKMLQEKVQKLEISLLDKKEFKFRLKKNPSDLSSVIDFEGLDAMGIYKHFKLENIWFSKRRNKFMVELSRPSGSGYYSVNDTISGGIIRNINEKSLIFIKDEEEFIYVQGEKNYDK